MARYSVLKTQTLKWQHNLETKVLIIVISYHCYLGMWVRGFKIAIGDHHFEAK